jgi:hypothetical protein
VPDTQKYFSNQNVPAPLAMEQGGVWLTISVNLQPGSPCGTHSAMRGSDIVTGPITIDGDLGTKWLSKTSMSASVSHQNWCYEFSFITYSGTTRDQNMNDMDAILASFRFNR